MRNRTCFSALRLIRLGYHRFTGCDKVVLGKSRLATSGESFLYKSRDLIAFGEIRQRKFGKQSRVPRHGDYFGGLTQFENNFACRCSNCHGAAASLCFIGAPLGMPLARSALSLSRNDGGRGEVRVAGEGERRAGCRGFATSAPRG